MGRAGALLASSSVALALLSGCSVGLPDSAPTQGPAAPAPAEGTTQTPFAAPLPSTPDSGPTATTPTPTPPTPTTPPPNPTPPPACLVPVPMQAVWAPPYPPYPGQCSQQQAATLANCEFGDAPDENACNQFFYAPQNYNCMNCAYSDLADTQHSAIITDAARGSLINSGGCIALYSGDSSNGSCGARYETLIACEYDQCSTCGQADWDACMTAADRGPCAAYASALACSAQYDAACTGATDLDTAARVITVFCGY